MNCNKQDPISARFYMLDAAVARDDARQALKHIYCDGENIVATNGKILVFTENMEQLAKGFYDLCMTGTGRDKRTKFVPVTDEKAKEWNFPNWKKVVPDCTGGKTLEFHGGAAERELEIFKLQFALASMGTGALIGQEYIDLICKPQLNLAVRIIDGYCPLVFELAHFFTLLVMPKRANVGKSEVNALFDAYKNDVIAAWEKTAQPEETAADAETAPETVKAEPVPEPAPEPEMEPEPEPVAVDAGEPEVEPVAEPVPEPETRRKAPKAAAKPKTRRERKPAFSYLCQLKNGKQITLSSIAEVKARGDVVHCHIEPVRKTRKAA